MRMSGFFLPTFKNTPAEVRTPSHSLMLRAGMIQQQAPGIYVWLPLGLKVLKKLEKIVHEEQVRAGHNAVLMPVVQQAELWKESGRYAAYGAEMLRVRDRHGKDMLFGPTNEEVITDVFRTFVGSYKALPLTLYQIQWKFRDEIRPRHGVMRGREFLMKDGYSFDLTREGAIRAYNRHLVSYLRSYERMGVQAIPMRADAGAIGGEHTHEFIVLAQTGESDVFYDTNVQNLSLGETPADPKDAAACESVFDTFSSLYARTSETHDPALYAQIPAERQGQAKGIEVGQIFYFGTKYSEAMGAFVTNAEGGRIPAEMGSYGIGVSRLVGAIIEANHDDRGIVWPEGSTPFHVAIVNVKTGDVGVDNACVQLMDALAEHGIESLYDDRDERPGVKFADMDLIGIPWRVTVGPRGIACNQVDITSRRTGETVQMSITDAVAFLQSVYAAHL